MRVLILGASADGGLRVGREQKRIRAAVESALHRDQIDLDVRPAATAQDVLDGVTKFRPHVVHFSGHSNEQLIEFEDDADDHHDGVIVSAEAFTSAVRATDDPPLLILLNSCKSAAQIDDLVVKVCPFAIGMADSIDEVMRSARQRSSMPRSRTDSLCYRHITPDEQRWSSRARRSRPSNARVRGRR